MSSPAQRLADQAELFAALTGVTKPEPWHMFFLVMGRTGSGKSTFISRCTGKNVNIGHNLQSCTSNIDVFDFEWNGRRVFLIDTPGFNDTTRSDIDVLETIASCLSASYANGVRIHGILMLHPISDNRMTGSSLRNINMMIAMCGFASYKNLAIVTTMWPESPTAKDKVQLEHRLENLSNDQRFFGCLIDREASVFRYSEKGSRHVMKDMSTSKDIMETIIRRSNMHPSGPLQLQREIVDEQKALGETAAGIVIAGDIHRARREHEENLQKIETQMETELAQANARHLAEMAKLKRKVASQMEQLDAETLALHKSLEEMHKEGERQWSESLAKVERQCQQRVEAMERQIHDLEEPHHNEPEHTDKSRRASEVSNAESLGQQKISHLREEVALAKDAQGRFAKYKVHILNGTASGVASGVTAGAIAAAAAGTSGVLLCTVM